MSPLTLVLTLVLLAFGALTAYALVDVGYWGIIGYHWHSSAGWQVITDLVIVCVLAIFWMVADARKSGRTVWPYVLITLSAGAFGPLLYLWIGSFGRMRAHATA